MISIPERKEQPLVLIKGVIIPADGTELPSDLEIVATNNETGIVTGVYKPLMRDGSFTIIIPPNSNYTLSYQRDGQEFYSELMEVPADAAYQEINRELKLKPVNFGQVVSVDSQKDSVNLSNNNAVSYITVEGRMYDENNKPLNALKVNLMDADGKVIKTTTTDELGWFMFNELPSSSEYIVALDTEDPHFIGKKSFAEFKDEKGNLLKTKQIGSKYQLAQNPKTSVKFKNSDKAVAAVKGTKTAPQPVHEQLASVDKLNFKMNFKYNVTEIDVNDAPYAEFITNLVDLYTKNGVLNINLISSASMVPTRAYKSNKELSIARSNKAKEQLIQALKAKGVDESKITFVKVKSIVDGPNYNSDYIMNRATYEKFQFIKIAAY
ncbi:MAG: hypothetical protein IPH89_03155 [Bacteroidetes bacterium]|nr:hypothetical protein [Bacteroidota bacterium]